jgi:hypothetical protein
VATREELQANIQGVIERLESLLPDIAANLEKPLTEGTWTVNDAICHIAADTQDAVPRWRARMQSLAAGESGRLPGFNIDDYNQQQIDRRKGRSVQEVVQEIRDGLRADSEAIDTLEDDLLKLQVPSPRGGGMTEASEMLSFYVGRHNHIHLDDIEKALSS